MQTFKNVQTTTTLQKSKKQAIVFYRWIRLPRLSSFFHLSFGRPAGCITAAKIRSEKQPSPPPRAEESLYSDAQNSNVNSKNTKWSNNWLSLHNLRHKRSPIYAIIFYPQINRFTCLQTVQYDTQDWIPMPNGRQILKLARESWIQLNREYSLAKRMR